MKTYTSISAILIAALNGLVLVPSLQSYGAYFVAGSIALALWLLVKTLTGKSPISEVEQPKSEPIATPPPVAKPAPSNQSEAEVLAVLGAFQEKGRLIDFLKDDVSAFSDAQVGAAARVVQQGCKAVLEENFEIVPVSDAREGTTISVPEDAGSDEYRLVGKVTGEPPFAGTLVHKGWKAKSVKLPRVLSVDGDRLPAIAPAQVELK